MARAASMLLRGMLERGERDRSERDSSAEERLWVPASSHSRVPCKPPRVPPGLRTAQRDGRTPRVLREGGRQSNARDPPAMTEHFILMREMKEERKSTTSP